MGKNTHTLNSFTVAAYSHSIYGVLEKKIQFLGQMYNFFE
jgi:hypothetical protein